MYMHLLYANNYFFEIGTFNFEIIAICVRELCKGQFEFCTNYVSYSILQYFGANRNISYEKISSFFTFSESEAKRERICIGRFSRCWFAEVDYEMYIHQAF